MSEFTINMADAAAYSGIPVRSVMEVSLTGGEPLVRRDFMKIVDALLAGGIRITTMYSPNLIVSQQYHADTGGRYAVFIHFPDILYRCAAAFSGDGHGGEAAEHPLYGGLAEASQPLHCAQLGGYRPRGDVADTERQRQLPLFPRVCVFPAGDASVRRRPGTAVWRTDLSALNAGQASLRRGGGAVGRNCDRQPDGRD